MLRVKLMVKESDAAQSGLGATVELIACRLMEL